jgi:hypothetical protein
MFLNEKSSLLEHKTEILTVDTITILSYLKTN